MKCLATTTFWICVCPKQRHDCADLFYIWHHFCSSETAMASLMQPPELHSALNNATIAFPRVWYCHMAFQHPRFPSSQHIHKQKSSLMITVKFRHWMARRGSNRHRLFWTGRKLEDKEPGRSVHSSLLALSPHHPLLPFHRKICPIPSTEISQELRLLLLPVGSHFCLTNDITRHFIFCLFNPYLWFRISPITLSYEPLK